MGIMTDVQIKAFQNEYLNDELSRVEQTMSDSEKKKEFGTTDVLVIEQKLYEGVKGIKTYKELFDSFGDKYAHIAFE